MNSVAVSSGLDRLLAEHFGLSGRMSRLPGQGLNFRLEAEQGQFVVKLTPALDQNGQQDALEQRLIDLLATTLPDLSWPVQVSSTRSNDTTIQISLGEQVHELRVLRYIEGATWADDPSASPERLTELGRLAARLALAVDGQTLSGFDRSHLWDMTRLSQHASLIRHVQDASLQAAIEWGFQIYTATSLPLLDSLPRGPIHGDLNEENIVIAGDEIIGLIDFGDCLDNPLVCDLAIASGYVLMTHSRGLDAVADLIAGYLEQRELSQTELDSLYGLMVGRLCMSLVIAAERRTRVPDHPAWFSSVQAATDALLTLHRTPPVQAHRQMLARSAGCETAGMRLDQGDRKESLIARRKRSINPSLSLAYEEPIHMVQGRAQYLIDRSGQPYLDMVNNVCHVGHCHPQVVTAAQRQMADLNTNSRYLYDGLTDYAERLLATLPDEFTRCYFVNSGSEANELALRLAMAHTGRRDFLVVDGAYHGNTANLIAISPYKFMGHGGEGHAQPWVHVVPLADGYRGPHKGQGRQTGKAYARDFARVLATAKAPIAGFITESLLSCGGSVIPSEGYLTETFAMTRDAGGVCIADEVQVGFGRCGSHFWAFESQDAMPDIVVLGKPIGNGHPMAAVITTETIAQSFKTGMEYFSTFGGNPVSCAVGMAVMDVIEEQQLMAHAARVGAHMLKRFEALKDRHDLIGDVRGMGLFAGIELVRDRKTLEPADTETEWLVNRLCQDQILLVTDGPHHNVIKIKPPMVVTELDIDRLARRLDRALIELSSGSEVDSG